MYWFTSDEHYGHANIIKYCNRPFADVHEMNKTMTDRFNEVVQPDDITMHCGDFTLQHSGEYVEGIIHKLKGKHIFITGSHDKWINNFHTDIPLYRNRMRFAGYLDEYNYNGPYIVACHYAMRVWPRSHYGSIQVYGHSHGNLPPQGRQMDVGVDAHNFYPISLNQVIQTINLNQGTNHGKASTSP